MINEIHRTPVAANYAPGAVWINASVFAAQGRIPACDFWEVCTLTTDSGVSTDCS
jgi:hypothetical protein